VVPFPKHDIEEMMRPLRQNIEDAIRTEELVRRELKSSALMKPYIRRRFLRHLEKAQKLANVNRQKLIKIEV